MAKSVQIQQVLKTHTSWDKEPLIDHHVGPFEYKVLVFKIAPGGKVPVHVHPLHGAGYMIRGELTMYSTNDPHGSFKNKKHVKKITLKAGEAWADLIHTWHYGENRGHEEVEFVLIFAGPREVPPTLSLQNG